MRCRKHYSDTTSSVGVCSTCLRERLLALIAAQSDADSLPPPTPSPDHRRRKPPAPHDPHLHHPPVLFPRSVSPYISFPKSNTDRNGRTDRIDPSHSRTASDPRFFSTPQGREEDDERRRRKSKFGLISSLFRSRSRKCGPSVLDPDPRVSATAATDSPSSSSSFFFSGLIRRGSRRVEKNHSMMSLFSAAEEKEEEKKRTESRHRCRRDRGMSPEETEPEAEWGEESPEYYSPAVKMTPMWKRTPSTVKPGQCRVRQSPGRSALPGFGFCLSPLVRVGGPNRSEIG